MKLTGYYTKAGEQIAAGLLAGKTLSVARITAGSGSTGTDAAQLDQEKQDLGPCTPEVSGTTAVIRCTLTSTQAAEPYFLRELGVYALDEEGRQVLYLIFRLDEEVSIHPSFRLVLRFNLEQTLSDGAGIKVTAPLTGVATQEDLKTKADLVGGKVPYAQTPRLTGNKILYVDAASGDDANPGTQEQPFKTIQAAVDALPKDLGKYRATISVAAGTYAEDVLLTGFFGGIDYYALAVQNQDEGTVVLQSLRITSCASCVYMGGIQITGGPSYAAAVMVSGASVVFGSVTIQGDGSVQYGVDVGFYAPAQMSLRQCTVDRFSKFGVLSERASVVDLYDSTVKNCDTGVVAGSYSNGNAGLMVLHGVSFEGNSTDTLTKYGGQIFQS